MKKIIYPCIISLICFEGASVVADEQVEEITITTHKSARAITKSGASVTVFDLATLEDLNKDNLAEVLRLAPGVSASRSGGAGGVTSIRLRGADAGQTLFMVNGIKMNDLSSPTGGYNFATFDMSQVERVEIVRGPQSIMWGSDAIGGVINVITGPRDISGLHWSGGLEGGSYDSRNLKASVAYGGADISTGVALNLAQSDGYSAADSINGNSEKDGYKRRTLDGWMSWKLQDSWQLDGSYRHMVADVDYDRYDFVAGIIDGDDRGETKETVVGLDLNGRLLDGRMANSLKVSQSDISRDDFSDDTRSLSSNGKRQNFSYLADIQLDHLLGLSMGAELERNDIVVEGFGAYASFVEGAADIKSLMTEARFDPNEVLGFSAGVRVDDHDRFGSKASIRLTTSWLLPDVGSRLKASYGTGFKAPTLYQLYSSFGNEALTAETAKAFDVGLEQNLPDDWGQLSITYFNRKSSDKIDFSLANFIYENLNRSKASGLETGLALNLTDTLTANVTYTHQSAVDRDSEARLLRRPRDILASDLRWQISEQASMGASLYHVGSQQDVGGTLPAYTLLDWRAEVLLTDQWSLTVRVDNLRNVHYQEITGFGMPGRSGYLGLRFRS